MFLLTKVMYSYTQSHNKTKLWWGRARQVVSASESAAFFQTHERERKNFRNCARAHTIMKYFWAFSIFFFSPIFSKISIIVCKVKSCFCKNYSSLFWFILNNVGKFCDFLTLKRARAGARAQQIQNHERERERNLFFGPKSTSASAPQFWRARQSSAIKYI